jgi:DNA gyrase/topoisomerase IV subunit A
LPFGVTTNTLIDSILKANDKGLIKIKKVNDNTAKDVEIQLELMPGVSPDLTIDALYAFTDCEVSYSPNACVIVDNKPMFLSVPEILRISTAQTKGLTQAGTGNQERLSWKKNGINPVSKRYLLKTESTETLKSAKALMR